MAYNRVVLDGDMSLDVCLDGNMSMSVSFDGDMSLDLTPMSGEFGVFSIIQTSDYPFYDGVTDVDPTFDQQILDTSNKTLKDDIEVHPIAVSKTTNVSGGNTVYIGGEIQYG